MAVRIKPLSRRCRKYQRTKKKKERENVDQKSIPTIGYFNTQRMEESSDSYGRRITVLSDAEFMCGNVMGLGKTMVKVRGRYVLHYVAGYATQHLKVNVLSPVLYLKKLVV